MSKYKLIENNVNVNKFDIFDDNLYVINWFTFNMCVDKAIFFKRKM